MSSTRIRTVRARPSDRTAPHDELVSSAAAFAATMPDRYRELFDDDAIERHAAIVSRRGSSATRVEIWRELDDGAAICVVAEDRPGLLSLISASLVAHAIDVIAAQAYCRAPSKSHARVEAVDFFWLRRVPGRARAGSIGAAEIAEVGEVLDALVRGKADFDSAVRFATTVRHASANVRVRFATDAERRDVLTLETNDRPGLLAAVSSALFRLRVQIVRSEVSTIDGRAVDRFHVTEFDGAPLRAGRRLQVQTEVLAALDTHRSERGASSG